jgi:hypothetical protein
VTFRRILLRVMLISLAIAAAVGAASILMVPEETTGRICGTAVLTAVVCGLLLLLSLLPDKPKSRPAGLLVMSLLLIEYLLILSLIWSSWNMTSALMEQVESAAFFIPLVGLPAVALLRFAQTPNGRRAGGVGVCLCGVEFLLLMFAARMDTLHSGDSKAALTAGMGAIFFALLITSLAGLGVSPGQWRRGLAIAASCVALAVSLLLIWQSDQDHPRAMALLISIPAVLAYVNAAMLCQLKGTQVWARRVAIIGVVMAASCIDLDIYSDSTAGYGEMCARLAGAAGIVAGCATLALAIFAALNRKIERPPVLFQEIQSLEVICPLCQKKQMLSTGGATCSECGLRIVVRLEQPQCIKCGYVLYGLKFERCPECGTPVADASESIAPGRESPSPV